MKKILLAFSILIIYSCQSGNYADIIIKNGSYFSGSANDSIAAIAIKGDRIIKIGSIEDMDSYQSENTKVIDAADKFVMPGFIEGHGHFNGFAYSLKDLNFLDDTSWVDIVKKVKDKVAVADSNEWIFGRGWHQEKWTSTPDKNYGAYPKHDDLSAISPNNPVILRHASGHASFANKKAMEVVGLNLETPDPKGGHIVRGDNGEAIGVFEERASNVFSTAINEYRNSLDQDQLYEEWLEVFHMAQKECLKNGVTSFQDAGLTYEELDKIEALAKNGELDIRLWVMLRERAKNLDSEKIKRYRKIGLGNNHYTCRAIKSEIDGALGAHGAWLIEPYSDKEDFYGQNTTEISDVKAIAKLCHENEMQLCVHAIGDRANKETLDIIEEYHKLNEDEIRWRVEHAQHLHPSDIERFKETGAIASMQGVHCTSDAPFVEKRLGFMRAKIGAYAWKALLERGVKIVNGTDVPVEKIDPFKNFYASVTRSRLDNGFRFFVDQRMTREQALKSYTIDAAYGAFEEDLKGSLETGKLADIIILDTNLVDCEDDEIPKAKVLMTMVGGEIKYSTL